MPSSPDQPDIILGEELTAYLDGELSREESEQLEQRLSEQEHVRSELQRFDRVWNALDQLPQATVGDSFTRTTIEMAAVEAEKDLALQTRQLPIQKRNYRLQFDRLVCGGHAGRLPDLLHAATESQSRAVSEPAGHHAA